MRQNIRDRRSRLGLNPADRPQPAPPVTTTQKLDDEFKRRILKARADKLTIADSPSTSPLATDFFKLAWEKLDSGVLVSPIEIIQRAVAQRYQLPLKVLLSHRRTKSVVRPRQVAMYLARRLTGASFPVIADRFGGRDHTGVMYSVSQIESFIRKDELIASEIKSLMAEIKNTVREAS
jgi:chromosomal replication initiation ATPase DnaA